MLLWLKWRRALCLMVLSPIIALLAGVVTFVATWVAIAKGLRK